MITDPKFLSRVEQTLDQLRPYLMADGGNVTLEEVTDDMVVKLKLTGACKDCKMSMMTLKAGLEQALLRAIPELTAVEAINIDEYSAS